MNVKILTEFQVRTITQMEIRKAIKYMEKAFDRMRKRIAKLELKTKNFKFGRRNEK